MLNLFSDGSDAGDPKDAPKGAPKDAAEGAPKGASEGAPKGAPEDAPKGAPKGAPESEGGDEFNEPVWTVSKVNRAVRLLLERTLTPLWVGGEVTNWTRARSGHCYFTLKDDVAQLRCVMFQNDAALLPTDPEEGMRVRAHGSLTLYEARGEFQLTVQKVEAEEGEGLWRLAFERLRLRLDSEGLLDAARKRAVPRYPAAVGVVTSPTGAAIRDILTVIGRRAPWTRVILRGARVQGDGAAAAIAAAVDLLGRSGLVDVVIVGRGGGSIEDLWAFNEEAVARAVAACPVPVISAVGHEIDVTISDLVADLRAPTPSAAAEAAVGDKAVLSGLLEAGLRRMTRGLRSGVDREARRVAELRSRLVGRLQRHVEERNRELGSAAGRLEALSPLSTLRRGYAVPLSESGRVLRSVSQFQVGLPFELRVADGRVACETTEIRADEPG